LQAWLFPSDGQTRDLNTLQVSLSSNDDFFASDQYGKISSREAAASLVPAVVDFASRRKSNTISGRIPAELNPQPQTPKLIRRRTELFTRNTVPTEAPKSDRRRNIILAGPPVRPSNNEGQIVARLRTQGIEEVRPRRTRYVDAEVQTETLICDENTRARPQKCEPQIVYVYVEAPAPVSIGSMQEFCRKSHYTLGDALGYV